MTAAPTPPPAGQFGPIRIALRNGWTIRWADDTVRHILEALDAAERRVAELAQEYAEHRDYSDRSHTLLSDLLHEADSKVEDLERENERLGLELAAAEGRAAELQAERDTAEIELEAEHQHTLDAYEDWSTRLAAAARQNETLLARLETERDAHREMYERQAKAVRIHTARADDAERRVAEAEVANRTLASNAYDAARENERLKEQLANVKGAADDALSELTECPDYETAMVSASKLCGTLQFTSSHAALAAEPREGQGEQP